MSDEELAAAFQECQFVISPSLYEGFGFPLREAFSFGKPILCSEVGMLPEIGGKAAYYFNPFKPFSIVTAIERLINDSALSTELIRYGYERISEFRREEMALRYLDIFDQTLQKGLNLGDEPPADFSTKEQILKSSTYSSC